jgi:hypothetical protein
MAVAAVALGTLVAVVELVVELHKAVVVAVLLGSTLLRWPYQAHPIWEM